MVNPSKHYNLPVFSMLFYTSRVYNITYIENIFKDAFDCQISNRSAKFQEVCNCSETRCHSRVLTSLFQELQKTMYWRCLRVIFDLI